MADDIFISYSRKDQEFVIRLASDLDAKVDGVWFDQSDIQAGDKWRDQIAAGIRHCKVFVLVLSPDSAASPYVKDELDQALAHHKRVIPILYRTVQLTGTLKDVVSDTQYIDLRRGSYADNFQKLVDALVAAGAARQSADAARPFLRGQARTDWGAVFGKIFGWAAAWGIGWMIFWFILPWLALIFRTTDSLPGIDFVAFPVAGLLGGCLGGLVAGLVTMLSLRRNAVSIAWKHMAPAIWIWAVSGPIGAVISAAVAFGVPFVANGPSRDCTGLTPGECLAQGVGAAIGEAIGQVIVIVLVMILLLLVAWFLTGAFAGWLAIRHIRRLEPGITVGQSIWVILGWGLGALGGPILALMLVALVTQH